MLCRKWSVIGSFWLDSWKTVLELWTRGPSVALLWRGAARQPWMGRLGAPYLEAQVEGMRHTDWEPCPPVCSGRLPFSSSPASVLVLSSGRDSTPTRLMLDVEGPGHGASVLGRMTRSRLYCSQSILRAGRTVGREMSWSARGRTRASRLCRVCRSPTGVRL